MKKLPTYIGVIIFVVTLLISWLLPSLAKVLNTFFIWTIVACLLYSILSTTGLATGSMSDNRDNKDSSKSVA
ncbi:TPA: hypothetical protein ACGO3Z_000175 [Streptococcus suis]|uniref:hypothetical protein n=1 Tax=Streptococcus parasuis TaxID=1501662 RepID=UPI001F2504E7|nr:hypothetical protein SUT007_20640 [Streptococcus parasuis]